MNQKKHPPSDEELDRLLAAPLPEPTPEFEKRWVDLKRQWRAAPPSVAWWRRWPGWLFVASPVAAAVVAAVMVAVSQPPPQDGDYELLMALDDSLEPAAVLLDRDSREALVLCAIESIPEDQP